MDELKACLKLKHAKKISLFQQLQRTFDAIDQLKTVDGPRLFLDLFQTLKETRLDFIVLIDEINELELDIDQEFIPNYEAINDFDDLYVQVLIAAEEPCVVNLQELPSIESRKRSERHSVHLRRC